MNTFSIALKNLKKNSSFYALYLLSVKNMIKKQTANMLIKR